MALIPWRNKQPNEPVRAEGSALSGLRTEIDRLFDSFLREPWRALEWPSAGSRGWAPTVDIAENETEITVRAEIPGIDPKELEVHVTGNQLVLAGEKKDSSEKKGKDFYQAESHYGSFRRVIPIPPTVDAEKVQAECANGVLTIRFPKVQSATAKRIEINVK